MIERAESSVSPNRDEYPAWSPEGTPIAGWKPAFHYLAVSQGHPCHHHGQVGLARH